MNNVADIIIQARMNSTRLPGKILLPFGGVTVLEYLVYRINQANLARKVIIATSDSSSDDAVRFVCENNGWDFFRGSESNVLGRFYMAAKKFGSPLIIRITADNPFTDMKETARLTDILVSENLDYISNHGTGLPLGTGAEAFTFKALERAYQEASTDYQKEHVTPYFYEHPEFFRQKKFFPEELFRAEDIRLTLDTADDYRVLTKIAEEFRKRADLISTRAIVDFLNIRPELKAINSNVVQRPFAGK